MSIASSCLQPCEFQASGSGEGVEVVHLARFSFSYLSCVSSLDISPEKSEVTNRVHTVAFVTVFVFMYRAQFEVYPIPYMPRVPTLVPSTSHARSPAIRDMVLSHARALTETRVPSSESAVRPATL